MELRKGDITKTTGVFQPKALIFMVDELNELVNSDDYKSVSTVKDGLGSIARLGRAAGVHLVLACQRASSNTINADLKNNIQLCSLLGGFDAGASSLMFDTDISHMAKPQIKGRGFTKSGNDLIEYQSYYAEPEDILVFDTDLKMTYNNPTYLKQCGKDSSLPTEWRKPSWFEENRPPIIKEEPKEEIEEKPVEKKSYRERYGGEESKPEVKPENFKHEIEDDDIMSMFKSKAEDNAKMEPKKEPIQEIKEEPKAEESKAEDNQEPNTVNAFASFREKMLKRNEELNKQQEEIKAEEPKAESDHKFKLNIKTNNDQQPIQENKVQNKFKLKDKE